MAKSSYAGKSCAVSEKAALPKALLRDRLRVLSYGKGEPFHRRFLVSAGIGFDAAVCQAARDSRLRSRLGHMGFRRFSYLLLGISQFFKCRSSRGYIVLDGVKRVEFNNILFISCHIQPSEGGGFVFAPKADGKRRADEHMRSQSF